jgi:hypothetical protein
MKIIKRNPFEAEPKKVMMEDVAERRRLKHEGSSQSPVHLRV